MKITWSASAWDEYVHRQGQDRKIVRKINELIRTSGETATRTRKARTAQTRVPELLVTPDQS
nr:type II toxin-antitoxin system YoeB family toxin [Glycomyces amatae]